jgi:hypothetical protein
MKNFILLIFVLFSFQLFGQKLTLSGIITDRKTGETLVGATVLLKGNVYHGTNTDINGFFSLPGIEQEKAKVEFSFIGYETVAREFDFAGQNKIFVEIKLVPTEIQLGQVTIVEKGNEKLGDREIEISQHSLTPKAYQLPITMFLGLCIICPELNKLNLFLRWYRSGEAIRVRT